MAPRSSSFTLVLCTVLLLLVAPLPFAAAEGNCRDQVFVVNGPDGQPAIEITMLRDYITPGSFVIIKSLLPNDGVTSVAMLLDGVEILRSDYSGTSQQAFKQHSFNFVLPLDASSDVYRLFGRFATLSFPAGFDVELEYIKCWEMCAACVKEEFYVLRSHRSALPDASASASADHVVSYDPEEDGLLIVSNTQQHMLFGLMPPTGWTIQETMVTILPDNIQLRLSAADIGAGFFAVPLANEMRSSRHINISFHVKIVPASGDSSQARIIAPVFDEETHDFLPYVLCSCL